MAFRKRNRFYKPKSQDINLSSNEEVGLSEYLANERRDEMIKSLPEKPAVRWWTRIGNKIIENMEEGFIKKIINIQLFSLLPIYIFLIIFKYFFYDIVIEHYKATVLFCTIYLLVMFIVPIYTLFKEGYKIFRETSLIQKVKTLKKDISSFASFNSVVFFINIILFANIEATLEPLMFLYQHPTIKKLCYSLALGIKEPSEGIIVLLILYFLIFFKILIAIIKATLQIFDDKWKYYKSSLFTLNLIFFTVFIAVIYLHLEKLIFKDFEKNQNNMVEFYNVIGTKYISVFLILYAICFIDLIIANYRIDKKLITEYEEKLRELQEFTARINRYGRCKISRN